LNATQENNILVLKWNGWISNGPAKFKKYIEEEIILYDFEIYGSQYQNAKSFLSDDLHPSTPNFPLLF
jgi:hypothetical protein